MYYVIMFFSFEIESNRLIGSLPSQLGKLTSLTSLQLQDNFLVGIQMGNKIIYGTLPLLFAIAFRPSIFVP